MLTPQQKKNNLRTGLILASIAVVFFIGFFAKMVLLNQP
nr:cytochrome oxidase small assembly protein [uncultured Albidiferax sp.]